MSNLQDLLKQALGDQEATFRPGQEQAIRALLEPPYRALVVQATGWGKSIVYFIATKVIRSRGGGPTIVVSPLLSLMRDQLRAASRLALRAAQFTSANEDEWDTIKRSLATDEVDMLLVAPERLANEEFRKLVGQTSLGKAGLLVIDEAHCISDWGHDFRPDYQRIGELVRRLPPTTPVIATTATANSRVVADIRDQIGREVRTLRGPLARESLQLQVMELPTIAERLAWTAEHLDKLPGSGVIYALTQRDSERVAEWLQTEGHDVAAYHSGLDTQRKHDLEHNLLDNKIKALVATVALGMGFDKPDLGFVVHFQSPGNLVAYYQQVGRAGRAIPDAVAILFLGEEDEEIHQWFINNARPDEDSIRAVLEELDLASGSERELSRRLNMKTSEIKSVLKTLSAMSPAPIVRVGPTYQLTPVPYARDLDRERKLIARRNEERERFLAFAGTSECLMKVVRLELDDHDAKECGRCANCIGRPIVPTATDEEMLAKALLFIKHCEFPITPRKAWAKGAFPNYGFSGNIDSSHRCEVGVCLSKWGDPAVARWVREDKSKGTFRDELVIAAESAVRRLRSDLAPTWICAVPSSRSLNLVPDFAERLAARLGVKYVDAIRKLHPTEPQKHQRNSYHQAHNLDGAFEVIATCPGTVILVDDMVDSGWTFTVLGALLRQGGSGRVVPLALCSTSQVRSDD